MYYDYWLVEDEGLYVGLSLPITLGAQIWAIALSRLSCERTSYLSPLNPRSGQEFHTTTPALHGSRWSYCLESWGFRRSSMADQNLEPKSSKVPHTKAPIPGDRQATSPAAERTERAHKHALPHPLDRRVPPSDKRDHSPNFTWADKEKSRRKNAREAEDINLSSPPSPFSSVTYSSDEDSVSSSPGRVNLPQLHNISVSPENPSDNTIHFTLDVADDIESHLEELSRLKRWGHFKEATQYFGENLEHQLDLPLVFLQYSDLLIEQGAYGERLPSGATHWWDDDQKAKCLPIGNEQHGPNLYTLHLEVLTLRAELFSQSLSGEDLDFLHTDNFWKYLDERTASRHEVRIPFDSTEVLSHVFGKRQFAQGRG